MSSDRTLFQFNILPAKTAREVAIEAERDNSTMYALLLMLFASFIYLIIIIAQAIFIDTRRAEALATLEQRQQIQASFNQVRSLHGELFIKTRTLRPVLDKNIDTKEIFRVADEIKTSRPSLNIESYSRERTGEFVFIILSPSTTDVPEIIRVTENISGVSDVFLRSAVVNTANGLTRSTIVLNIEAS